MWAVACAESALWRESGRGCVARCVVAWAEVGRQRSWWGRLAGESKVQRGEERALSPWSCSSSAFCSRRSSFLTDLSVALPCSTMSESSAASSLRLSSCQPCGVRDRNGTLDRTCGALRALRRSGGTGCTGGTTSRSRVRWFEVCGHTHCLATRCTQGVPDACWEKVRQGGRVRGPPAYLALVRRLLALLGDLWSAAPESQGLRHGAGTAVRTGAQGLA